VAKPPDLNGPTAASFKGAENVGTGYALGAVAGSVQDLRSADRQDGRDPGTRAYSRGSMPFTGSAATVDSASTARAQDLRHLRAGADITQKPPVPGSSSNVRSGSSSDGFEWGSAAAGAGVMLVIGLAGLGGWLAVSRRRGATGANATTVAAGH
jgi:hypothetical protein